jgi:HJR/Mrr/RecB family endonuclease
MIGREVSKFVRQQWHSVVCRRYPKFELYFLYNNAQFEFECWLCRTMHSFWEQMNGRTFEIEVRNLIRKLGNDAEVTGGKDDEGIDIIVDDGTVVQCKAHKKPVSPAVAREFYGAMTHVGASRGVLVSLNGFTTGVFDFVRGKPIELWDVHDLVRKQKGVAA